MKPESKKVFKLNLCGPSGNVYSSLYALVESSTDKEQFDLMCRHIIDTEIIYEDRVRIVIGGRTMDLLWSAKNLRGSTQTAWPREVSKILQDKLTRRFAMTVFADNLPPEYSLLVREEIEIYEMPMPI